MPDNARKIRRVTWVALLTNLVLSALKFVAGWLGRSSAVMADGVHSLSDVATDVAVLVGSHYWSAPPDQRHPYGHGRIETVITFLIGVSLAGVAIRIGSESLTHVRDVHTVVPSPVALGAAVLSILCKGALYHWTVHEGRRLSSRALVANAWHHRSDALSSIPVAVAVAASIISPRWAFVDHLGAIVVSVFILKAAYDIGGDALRELMDAGVSSAITTRIRGIAEGHQAIREVHRIRTRRAGPGLYVDLHLLVDQTISVLKGHEISEQVKQSLLESDLHIEDVVVHLEPYPAATKTDR